MIYLQELHEMLFANQTLEVHQEIVAFLDMNVRHKLETCVTNHYSKGVNGS